MVTRFAFFNEEVGKAQDKLDYYTEIEGADAFAIPATCNEYVS